MTLQELLEYRLQPKNSTQQALDRTGGQTYKKAGRVKVDKSGDTVSRVDGSFSVAGGSASSGYFKGNLNFCVIDSDFTLCDPVSKKVIKKYTRDEVNTPSSLFIFFSFSSPPFSRPSSCLLVHALPLSFFFLYSPLLFSSVFLLSSFFCIFFPLLPSLLFWTPTFLSHYLPLLISSLLSSPLLFAFFSSLFFSSLYFSSLLFYNSFLILIFPSPILIYPLLPSPPLISSLSDSSFLFHSPFG